jgi:hypothetical protein
MANRKTFNDFTEDLPKSSDYVIGYSDVEPGGERKFRLADLKGFMHTTGCVKVMGNTQFSDTSVHSKFYHVHDEADDNLDVELSLPQNPDFCMQFGVVNMTDHKSVSIISSGGSINSRGHVLRKKFDTAILYWDGKNWNAYGDLAPDGGVSIKTISEDYTFSKQDADCLIHVNSSESININLPDPGEMQSGTQFYLYNLSPVSVTLKPNAGIELHSRSTVLRKKYDDVLVYTDGVKWFATGDLT